jgi:hypothetical protein
MASLDFSIKKFEMSVFDCEKPVRILLEEGCSIIIHIIKAEKGQKKVLYNCIWPRG